MWWMCVFPKTSKYSLYNVKSFLQDWTGWNIQICSWYQYFNGSGMPGVVCSTKLAFFRIFVAIICAISSYPDPIGRIMAQRRAVFKLLSLLMGYFIISQFYFWFISLFFYSSRRINKVVKKYMLFSFNGRGANC